MATLMVVVFVAGYALIAMEHEVKINKAATAIVLGMSLWVLYAFSGESVISGENAAQFERFISASPEYLKMAPAMQYAKFVSNFQVVEYLGEYAQIILYLIGAMTIVEVIDVHGGFSVVTNKIRTDEKRKLLWILSLVTFFMSAVLDNLTTAIVMTMLLRKLVASKKDRWLYASMIVISANSGGAWTPTGDVTTIMLWMGENVTTIPLMRDLFLPSLLSMLVPLLIVSKFLGSGTVETPAITHRQNASLSMTPKKRLAILLSGISALVSVPVFKAITGLPPFMGILLAFGLIWILLEMMYNRKSGVAPSQQFRVQNIIGRIDITTVVFFVGILMSVAALQSAGVLKLVSDFLDTHVHNAYVINSIIGILSAIVDNVPLVAGAMGAYTMPTPGVAAASSEIPYLLNFVQDGVFWQTLAYCAGVGGSMLIIGSAAGVIVMGLEKITFVWYLKKVTPAAFMGYASGIAAYAAQSGIAAML